MSPSEGSRTVNRYARGAVPPSGAKSIVTGIRLIWETKRADRGRGEVTRGSVREGKTEAWRWALLGV
jgi:hypothetical protein